MQQWEGLDLYNGDIIVLWRLISCEQRSVYFLDKENTVRKTFPYINEAWNVPISYLQDPSRLVFSITCLVADPCGLDGLWFLPVEHHAYELQAVDAQI